jgi:hypothetical protein
MRLISSDIWPTGKRLGSPHESIRYKFYVFLVCLVISILMWFMIILSRESISSLEYSVKYSNLPEGMALLNSPDSLVTFMVSKGGLEMIALKYFTRRKPLEVDLNVLDLKPQGQFYISSFSTSRLASSLHRRFMLTEELISISPEEIFFRFELLSGKMVPVVPRVNLHFQKLFKQSGNIKTIPDSVKIVAPKGVLNKISLVETVPVSLKEISGEVRFKADVALPDPAVNIQVYPSEVEVVVPAEKFTEITIELPVESESPGVDLKTFPGRVRVTFWVALSDYGRIDDVMFRAVADISESPQKNRAPVKLISLPSFIEVIKIEPKEVEFLMLGHD